MRNKGGLVGKVANNRYRACIVVMDVFWSLTMPPLGSTYIFLFLLSPAR